MILLTREIRKIQHICIDPGLEYYDMVSDMPWRDLAGKADIWFCGKMMLLPAGNEADCGLSYPGYRGITVKFTDSYGIGKWLYWELGELNPTGEMVTNFNISANPCNTLR